tara:strand:+ start:4836 stop:6320 length:1485 start_codon:yes stop_codon:yes gene_type:complete
MILSIQKHKWKFFLLICLFYFKKHYKYILFYLYSKTKKGHALIEDKKEKAKQIIKNDLFRTKFAHNYEKLPWYGIENEEMDKILTDRKNNVNSRISGCIYTCDVDLEFKIKNISNKFLYSNPLHPDIYPGLIKMESEVVKMVGHLFDLPKDGGGNITTGGTESTILALKAYKKMFNSKRWFKLFKPEVLCTKTVHAAVNKACELLDLKMVYVELDENNIMDINDLYWKITPQTCVIIGSAPCFPYGLIDPIKAIGELAKQYNVPFHVDACLGGFIIQYDVNLKLTFDDNIQSISVDPHKYGLAPKGSSLLLWKDRSMKKYQYFVAANWTGGLYASVSLPGSRVGSQIATTWAALLFNGNANYKAMSRKIKNKTIDFAEELRQIPNFKVIGWPNVNVVAFYNTKYSVAQLSKFLKRQNWNINILQNPLCLHICLTPKNVKYIDMLLVSLKKFNDEPINKNKDEDITAIYGMAAEIPDKSIITTLVNYYLDMTTNI